MYTANMHPTFTMSYQGCTPNYVPNDDSPNELDAMSPDKLNLASYLAQNSDADILLHFLGSPLIGAPELINKCIFITLSLEWWQKAPHPTTEIGIAELPPVGVFPNLHAENILKELRVAHARIGENAHLVNTYAGAGNPEEFLFGESKFVSLFEARNVLENTFKRMNKRRQTQPIIFVAHAAAAKLEHIKDKFELDLLSLGSIVRVIEVQNLAWCVGITGPKGPNISLLDLVKWHCIEGKGSGSAGNDAGYTLITAVLSALRHSMFPPICPYPQTHPYTLYNGRGPLVEDPSLGRSTNEVVENVMRLNRMAKQPPWGMVIYCTRCGRNNHLRECCVARVECKICASSLNQRVQKASKTHKTEKCFSKYWMG